jgi:hypothetical protein
MHDQKVRARNCKGSAIKRKSCGKFREERNLRRTLIGYTYATFSMYMLTRLERARQRLKSVRSEKRCRRCILGLMYPAYLRLEPCELDTEPLLLKYCSSAVEFWGLAAKRQSTSPKYNDDISLLIWLYCMSSMASGIQPSTSVLSGGGGCCRPHHLGVGN